MILFSLTVVLSSSRIPPVKKGGSLGGDHFGLFLHGLMETLAALGCGVRIALGPSDPQGLFIPGVLYIDDAALILVYTRTQDLSSN